MNRTKLIIISLIVLLCAIIGIKKFFSGTSLPNPGELKGTPSAVILKSPAGEITLSSENGTWFVSDKHFPADADKCKALLKKISGLTLVEQVSSKDNYARFGLTDSEATVVSVLFGGKKEREFFIGKTAQGASMSYVRLTGKKGVYLASGMRAADIQQGIDNYRNRKVLTLGIDAIDSIELSHAKGFKLVAETNEGKRSFVFSDKRFAVDEAKVKDLSTTFASLQADRFLDAQPSGKPISTLSLAASGKTYTVDVYAKDKENYFPAYYREGNMSFYLSEFKGSKFLTKSEDLKSAK